MASREVPAVEEAAPLQGPAAAASPPAKSPAAASSTEYSQKTGSEDDLSCLAIATFLGDVPHDLQCASCRGVPQQPVVTKCCSQVYSLACLENMNSFGSGSSRVNGRGGRGGIVVQPLVVVRGMQKTACCLAKTELSHEADLRRQRRVDSLTVKCKSNGCNWSGPLSALLDHGQNCDFADVRCEACGEQIARRSLEEHRRDNCRNRLIRCRRCNEQGPHAEIVGLDAPFTKKHRCPKALVTCPNQCRGSRKIERGLLAEHLKVCLLQNVECEFKIVGCRAQLNRKSYAQHMRDQQQQHLLMLLSTFHTKMSLLHGEVEFLMQNAQDPTTQASLACMSDNVKMGRPSLDGLGDKVTFRITNYKHLSEFTSDDGKWESPSFYLASQYHMELVAYPGGNGAYMGQSLSVYLNVSKPEAQSGTRNVNQDIGWPMDCAYVALQVSILPQVNHSSHPHPESNTENHDTQELLMPKPISFTAHVCHFCRQRKHLPTIPEYTEQTTAEVGRDEDFIRWESLTEAGLLFQDSVVLRVEQTMCECA